MPIRARLYIALVIAAGGTALAVEATRFSIQDPLQFWLYLAVTVLTSMSEADLDAAVDDLITRATRGSAQSKALGKHGFYAQIDMDQDKAYAYAVEVMAAAAVTPDAQEGIAAFLGMVLWLWAMKLAELRLAARIALLEGDRDADDPDTFRDARPSADRSPRP